MRGDRPACSIVPPCLRVATPHARGSTSERGCRILNLPGYPACAGIDHQTPTNLILHSSATPHARGSTYSSCQFHFFLLGYPACAGIDLTSSSISTSVSGLPRMRGDRPRSDPVVIRYVAATPHARGSTAAIYVGRDANGGYPACAGIDRLLLGSSLRRKRLPRMRGDRPFIQLIPSAGVPATPHARGSTLSDAQKESRNSGYPACAGIDLVASYWPSRSMRLPRMRGDRPLLDQN